MLSLTPNPLSLSGGLLRRNQAAAVASPLLTDLIAYWDLDEASGTRADSHTNGLDLTDNNTVGSGTGPDGGTAASFLAVNSESLSIADTADLSVASGQNMTIVISVLLTSKPSVATFCSKGSSAAAASSFEYFLGYSASADRFRFSVSDGSTIQAVNSASAPSTGTWYHIIAEYDGANVSIRVDNGTAATAEASQGPRDYTGVYRLGYDGSSFYHNGRIAYVGFWKRTLSAAERTFLYNSGNGRSYADIAAYTG